ncbi:SAM-dependent methyltransferase [Nonomuraea sp. NPDC049784]|uniref:SAM-dependent methyltransferase n=1 Tax=Nonomuraea sp. NPDC049784 TaxID=3154361 RepID=UPI0033D4481E
MLPATNGWPELDALSKHGPERSGSPAIDPHLPNGARMYDSFLGGKDNYGADRAAALEALRLNPDAALCAQANRAFPGRAVQFVAESGVRQLLDLGTRLPAMGNVHEVAQDVHADAWTVYVDYDPVAVLLGRALLATSEHTVMMEDDLRRRERILATASGLLGLGRPVRVLLMSSLHFVTDAEDPHGVVSTLMRVTVPGSYLVLTHVIKTAKTAAAAAAYRGASAPVVLRTEEQVEDLFAAGGVEAVSPGVVRVPQRGADPEDPYVESDAARAEFVGGVGRKP